MALMNKTVGDLLEEQVEQYGDQEAVVYPESGVRLSYRAFNERVDEVARGLLAIGIKKGDHVAIWSDNKLEWVLSQFATAKIGAVLVTVNTNYQAFELEYLLKQSDAMTLIMAKSYKGTSYLDILEKICPNLKTEAKGALTCPTLHFLINIIILDGLERTYAYTFKEVASIANEVELAILEQIKTSLRVDDVINMQYTSGTTGFPKGVMLSHYNIVNNAKQIGDRMHLTNEDRLCIPVPFFHTFGCVLGILTAVAKGTTMVLLEQFHAEKVLQAVSDEKC